jgi:hypothetical protein
MVTTAPPPIYCNELDSLLSRRRRLTGHGRTVASGVGTTSGLSPAAGTTYDAGYGGVASDGELTSRINVFTRRDGTVRHFYATEKGPSSPGQDDRHLDLLWTLWGALDLTPEGRGPDWRPTRAPRRPFES